MGPCSGTEFKEGHTVIPMLNNHILRFQPPIFLFIYGFLQKHHCLLRILPHQIHHFKDGFGLLPGNLYNHS